MLYLAILLHIYQPPTQFPEVTKEITESSYRLILKILRKSKSTITLNIAASLTEQLARLGQDDVLRGISDLAKEKQIEFTGSAAYHPLLPRLPQDLMKREITLNTKINKKYFGDLYCPVGFFPPEMAYSNPLGEVLEELGYTYVVIDEHGYPGRSKKARHDVIYVKKDTNSTQIPHKNILSNPSQPLNIFFRSDDLSLSVAFSQITTLSEFHKMLKNYKTKKDSYHIIALDGETFGHHQLGQDQLLFDILSYKKIKIVNICELKKYFHKEKVIRAMRSCWGVDDEDMRKKIYWPRWSYPGNPIHKLQWELTRLVIKSRRHSGESLGYARDKLRDSRNQNRFWTSQNDEPTLFDKALHSDQYWWASHKPYWHPEMIRRGAELLVKTLKENPDVSDRVKKHGERLYYDIVETAEKLYGNKIISN